MTALTSAVLTIWVSEVDRSRELELRIVREGLVHDDSRTVLVTGSVPFEDRKRLEQLGYEHHYLHAAGNAREWLDYVAERMRERMAVLA